LSNFFGDIFAFAEILLKSIKFKNWGKVKKQIEMRKV